MNSTVRFLLSLIVGGMLISAAFADSWVSWRDQRVVSHNGKYYVVMQRTGGPKVAGQWGPVDFIITERRQNSPPVTPAHSTIEELDEYDPEKGFIYEITSNPQVSVRDGDMVLGRGKLKRPPLEILISSSGQGFATLDVYGYNYADTTTKHAVIIVSNSGEIRHRLSLDDLFTKKQLESFETSAGGMWWCEGGWIDDRRSQVVVVATITQFGGELHPLVVKTVDLGTGKVNEGEESTIVRALEQRNGAALELALYATAKHRIPESTQYLPGILGDESLKLRARLRAAVALALTGDRRGGELMTRSALEASDAQQYAVRHLPTVVGDDAAATLCVVVEKFGDLRRDDAWYAMRKVSAEASVPRLIELLRERKSSACVDFAIECLGDKGAASESAVPLLVDILKNKPSTDRSEWTQRLAAMNLEDIGAEAKLALPELAWLAEMHAPEEWEKAKNSIPRTQSEPEEYRNTFVKAYFRILNASKRIDK